MKKIYEHFDFPKVGHFQSILESAGIRTLLKNETQSSMLRGEVGIRDLFPELWVMDDSQYERAVEILTPLLQEKEAPGEPWVCPQCGEQVDGNFGECWNCQTERPTESEER